MKLSKWTYNTEENFQNIIDNLLDYQNWWEYEEDPFNQERLSVNISKYYDENQDIVINGNIITYNYIDYLYEKVRPGENENEMRSTRIYQQKGFLIIYSDGTSTQIITNRSSNNGTKTVLRKINNCSKNLEIIANKFDFSEDMFIWTIYKALMHEEIFSDEETQLIIERIIGFKGATEESAEVIGKGSTIMNLLSTLAFLFENETVSIIQPRINYNNNNVIDLKLDINGNVEMDFDTYIGDYLVAQEETRNSNVSLIALLDIIPKFLAAYLTDKEENMWSNEIKNTFFVNIGKDIQAKIEEKLSK